MFTRFLLLGIFVVSLSGAISVGLGGSDQNIVTNLTYLLAIPYVGLLVFGALQWRKGSSLGLSGLLFAISIIYSFFVLVSYNCTRCITHDMHSQFEMRALKDTLDRTYQEAGEYPQALPPQQTPILHQDRYRYMSTGNTYELCTIIKKHTFYGIPTNDGEEYCVHP